MNDAVAPPDRGRAADVAALLARLFLAGLFLYMGLTKALHPVEFLKLVRQYEVLPQPLALNLVAAALPWFEIFCALLLLAGVAVRGAAVMLVAMLIPFTGLILLRALALRDAGGLPLCSVKFDCGCGAGEVFACRKIAENIGLTVLALGLAFRRQHRWALRPSLMETRAAGVIVALVGLGLFTAGARAADAPQIRPNIVLIFCDDLAYADLGCYGAEGLRTPNLDQLAREGMRFTDFYVPQAVCSASRAALLTGCYPNRVGIFGALGPEAAVGLHPREITLAELLKAQGYATAIYGKWHLGRPSEFLPRRQGFDDYFGLPYSNDMWPKHPTTTNYPPLPLLAGEDVVELMPDQTQLTTWYTERAVKFIAAHTNAPFFLYVPHNMPHVPLFVSDKFRGKSARGLFGDVIEELDWSVGEILGALRRHHLETNTLVIFSSDNGPWLLYGDHAGSAGPLREGKGTSFDGGVRVPFLVRWPGRIPAGTVCREPAITMDLLPTLARFAGAEVPKDRVIDGRDLGPLLSGTPGATSPHEALFFYWGRQLQAVRSGQWKLHLAHDYLHPDPRGGDGKPGKPGSRKLPRALFDLQADAGETNDVSAQHPEIVTRLEALAEKCRDDLGDSAVRRTGRNIRLPGRAQSKTAIVPTEGAVVLHASEATVHGTNLRYEPQPHKNTLGFWTRAEDWASWEFQANQAGRYAVEILQGCGKGSGGSTVEFAVGEQLLSVTVQDTGGFQNFISRHIGEFELEKPGRYTLTVKPKAKPGLAVMDLRCVTLWPLDKPARRGVERAGSPTEARDQK